MLSKQQKRAALKLTRHETRKLLWELRQKHDMSLEDLSLRARIPEWKLDYLICGNLIDYPPAKNTDKDKE